MLTLKDLEKMYRDSLSTTGTYYPLGDAYKDVEIKEFWNKMGAYGKPILTGTPYVVEAEALDEATQKLVKDIEYVLQKARNKQYSDKDSIHPVPKTNLILDLLTIMIKNTER